VDLLERDSQLLALTEAFDRVHRGGAGVCVLVHGEAGIGKTALVQAFLRTLDPRCCLLAGCEALFTPRPLGPLVDLADRFAPSVSRALHEGHAGNGLFPTLLAGLRAAPAAQVLALEDIHWADAATLDFVRYAGRRLGDVPLLLLLTYRREEMGVDHPLRRALGELPGTSTRRIALQPLSAAAVRHMAARAGRAAAGVHEATRGNPFYVTELLAHPGPGVPASVADAVGARMARLGTSARELCEFVSMCPGRADPALLYAVMGSTIDDADLCVRQGLFAPGGEGLGFQHELVREAVHAAMPARRRAALHAAIFYALQELPGVPAARQVHHAEGAGLAGEVARLAPRAAHEAAASGAHREAARLYGLAVAGGAPQEGPDAVARAQLLEAQAGECLLANLHEQAVQARLEALALRRGLGDRLGEGINLRWLARLHWLLGRGKAGARELAHRAIELLETLPPQPALAGAYSTLSHLHLVGGDCAAAQHWGQRAIDLAQSLGDVESLSHALNNVASARLRLQSDERHWALLQRSLDLALRHGLHADAARAHNNLFITRALHRQMAQALQQAEEGIDYAEAHGVDVLAVRLRIRRAYVLLRAGRWDLAEADLRHVEQHHRMPRLEIPTFGFVRAMLNLRRGAPQASEELLRAADDMDEADAQFWFTSTAAARAEAAWLRGDDDEVPALVGPALERALQLGDAWGAGELAAWRLRCGGEPPTAPCEALPLPYALELAGRRDEAAAHWQRLGCPYDSALAWVGDDEEALRRAMEAFEAQGAGPAAEVARRRLRARGARAVPRGPQPRTRSDPLGLTAREREVFELLLQGLSNAAIAGRLHRSERTVEHHVAAVLGKTGAQTRAELIAGFGATGEPARCRVD
jgi:DNA-binding CsgD family transcriptional regulator